MTELTKFVFNWVFYSPVIYAVDQFIGDAQSEYQIQTFVISSSTFITFSYLGHLGTHTQLSSVNIKYGSSDVTLQYITVLLAYSSFNVKICQSGSNNKNKHY
jgi:hypothetical protein